MDKSQNKVFSEYLYERSNNLLRHLRETNSIYQGYLREIEDLSWEFENGQYNAEQVKAFHTRYAELKDLTGDIENIYLFTKGFAEYKRIEKYVAGEDVVADVFFPE